MFYVLIVTGAWLVWHLAFGIRVIGREYLPRDRGFVLAANHISAIDPVFVVIARFWGRRMIIMGKEEIFAVHPLLSWMFRNVGVVAVRRGAGDTELIEGVIRKVKEGQGLLIFPEGTRSKTGAPGRLKSGAFVIASAAKVDLVPCRIIYRHTFMRVFSRVRVCFGPPIPAQALDLGEKKSAARLRQNKQLLLDAWETLYRANRFPGQPEPPAKEPPARAAAPQRPPKPPAAEAGPESSAARAPQPDAGSALPPSAPGTSRATDGGAA